MHRNRAFPPATLGCLLLLGGCATVKSYWPFGEAPEPAPRPVGELVVTVLPDSPQPVVLQFWERNTLVVDLQGAASHGQIVLSRREGQDWPARIGFRMSPTRFEQLEVRGAQRIVLPVAAGGADATTVELPPGIFSADTAGIGVRWGLKSDL